MNTNFKTRISLPIQRNRGLIQLIKYSIFGSFSAIAFYGTLFLLRLSFPSFIDEGLEQNVLSYHVNIFNALAFIPSCLVAYYTNRRFVFNTGRHTISKEFTLFMIVTALSFVAGVVGSRIVVEQFNLPGIAGSLGFGISSALINFLCRKFLIFNG